MFSKELLGFSRFQSRRNQFRPVLPATGYVTLPGLRKKQTKVERSTIGYEGNLPTVDNLLEFQQIFDVVIVGAGLTGLSAARELKKNAPEARVKLLEARDEVRITI